VPVSFFIFFTLLGSITRTVVLVDRYDGPVVQAILSKYRPVILQMEINLEVPPPIAFSVGYDENYRVAGAAKGFFSTSMSFVQENIARAFGYTIVAYDADDGHDVILVRNDVAHLVELHYNVFPNVRHMWKYRVITTRDACFRWSGMELCDGSEAECKCDNLDCNDMFALAERRPYELFNRMNLCLREKSMWHNRIGFRMAAGKGTHNMESSWHLSLDRTIGTYPRETSPWESPKSLLTKTND
jgi:hypothetical protein